MRSGASSTSRTGSSFVQHDISRVLVPRIYHGSRRQSDSVRGAVIRPISIVLADENHIPNRIGRDGTRRPSVLFSAIIISIASNSKQPEC